MDGAVDRLHATAIAVGDRAIIIRGPSGSGKSDLALRCLALPVSDFVPTTPRLLSDDQVMLMRDGLRLVASAPERLFGAIEVRGVGILRVEAVQTAEVALIADIVERDKIERYPDPWPTVTILGLAVPLLRIYPYDAAAPLKLLAAAALLKQLQIKPSQ